MGLLAAIDQRRGRRGSEHFAAGALLTGEIQEVVRSNELFDWTSNLSVLPPLGNAPFTIVLAAMGQEENNPDVNVLLTAPQYVAPSLLTGVTVSNW